MTDPTPGAAPLPASARFWNRMARRYAAASMSDPAGYEVTLERVRGLLTPNDSVLELACGTGSTALRLAAGTREWLATDVAPNMIAIARDKLAAAPVAPLRFEVADADEPAFAPTRHDAVLAFNALHLMADLDRTLDGVLATLKPGGLFISKTPCLAELNPLLRWVVVPLLRVVRLAPALIVFDGHQLQTALERRGFRVETVERHGTRGRDVRVFIVARKP
jgi:ubiquinone/menaquinone biosynthesis C-methylase UbiE